MSFEETLSSHLRKRREQRSQLELLLKRLTFKYNWLSVLTFRLKYLIHSGNSKYVLKDYCNFTLSYKLTVTVVLVLIVLLAYRFVLRYLSYNVCLIKSFWVLGQLTNIQFILSYKVGFLNCQPFLKFTIRLVGTTAHAATRIGFDRPQKLGDYVEIQQKYQHFEHVDSFSTVALTPTIP